MPIFFSSGFTWPLAYMPRLLVDLVRLMPYPWMAEAFRLVSQKGAGLGEIAVNLLALGIMACLSLFFALNFSKRRNSSPVSPPDSCFTGQPAAGTGVAPTGAGGLMQSP
jgi:ABC-type multidrug transport system permease subunit